jgi:outer membrane protein OmpA-like peptidoglycan-associated protein
MGWIMNLRLFLIISVVAPAVAIYANGASNCYAQVVVAQATQQKASDDEKNKKKKARTPPAVRQQKPVTKQQKPVQAKRPPNQPSPPQSQKRKPTVQPPPPPSSRQQTKRPNPRRVQQPAQTQKPVMQKPAQLQQQQPTQKVQQPTKKRPPSQRVQGAKPQQPVQAPAQQQQQSPAAQQKPAFDKNRRPAPTTQALQRPAVLPNQQKLDHVRGQRREVRQGNRTLIQEQNRTIVRENGHTFIRHNDIDRFRVGARDVHVARRGRNTETVIIRPDGTRIITIVDANGRLVRRIRRDRSGHEWVLINNVYRGAGFGFIANLAPPVIHIPRDRYIVEADRADEALLYATLIAPPVMAIERPYALDEIRYTYALRERMPSIDLDTITFDTGSWYVTPDQAQRLKPIADAILRATQRNPNEVYLIEGHTDAVGTDIDNLSLSDRRAEAVAAVLTQDFGIAPENLTTQGYGEQYLKIPTQGPERRNRRVTVRRITPLLNPQVAQQQ